MAQARRTQRSRVLITIRGSVAVAYCLGTLDRSVVDDLAARLRTLAFDGVRGVVLALASLLLFQYSIEHNLITPPMRVLIGIVAGISCIASSEWLIRRRQPFAANALTNLAFCDAISASAFRADRLPFSNS